ncbi:TolC family protein [Puia dinghuensis]|uniref:Agglutination protein n=1 Tax=Puia dinghuensis TaxID=1792502 RepID=A0A8J2U9Z6_9BACT|nr:TolC family protein [Puia dinghuensis]GGA89291.1 agglutination protein [Puia dinghuensis]
MSKQHLTGLLGILLLGSLPGAASAQVLTLKQAVQTALNNYGTIRAKTNYVKASQVSVKESKMEYLPDLNISAQHVYGTVNSQYGPLGAYKVAGTASSGPVFATQNWNAAFGALYLTNVNWDFFQFGRAKERTKVAQTALNESQSDLDQERFQQGVKVSAAYLNVLAAQKLIVSQQRNLERAVAFQTVAAARAKTGLNPGVDSSLANAEVSNARIALTNAIEFEQEQANQLAQLMQVPPPVDWTLDTLFLSKIPASLTDTPAQPLSRHPVLQFFQQRINVSNEQAKYLKTFNYPTFSLFGVLQDRGSGFSSNYGQYPDAYTANYFKGVSFDRGNYLLGVGFVWNLTNPLRVHQQVASQKFISQGLQEEYGLINQELQAQLVLSATRIKNALDNYREAPIQVKAASDAYLQKETLYRNGLATIVDVTTAAFILNQAETERDIANNNVWQALLFKAASSGDFGLFFNEF